MVGNRNNIRKGR